MKVLNIHKRTINQPINKVTKLIATLSTKDDMIWPKDKWPKMKFKEGIQVGAEGGHGQIRYTVEKYNPEEIIQFRFSKPEGFHGIHKFEINELAENQTEVVHTIDMKATGMGIVKWIFAVRSLHNALIEDGFDRLENNFTDVKKSTEWNIWVRLLRGILA